MVNLFLTLAVLTAPGAAPRKPCLKYEPELVELVGVMRAGEFPGPPNYESVKTGDRLERYWLLHLSEPVCVRQPDPKEELNTPEPSVSVFQIVISDYEAFRPLLNESVRVAGTLFHGHTGHHHTPVLIRASKIEPAEVRQPGRDAPPRVYIDRGACPFECCTYRAWTVDADTELYDRPGGARLGVVLKRGERVSGLTGEVRVRPQLVNVLEDHQPFAKGDVFYLLTPIGEGFFRIWYRGKVSKVEVHAFPPEGPRFCPTRECWAKPEGDYRYKWWVRVRSESGTDGWSDEPDHFGNKDACG